MATALTALADSLESWSKLQHVTPQEQFAYKKRVLMLQANARVALRAAEEA